ncbi:MAG: hypothetical protein KDA86_14110 [Planctomycetaceae bacterium]|nr:hypothetical protein [Planctomycetaceae bacterium]
MIRATIIGFVLGATIPIAYGIYIIDRTHSYWESFANDPNTGFCGMPIVGAWVIIFAGGPIGAMCGAMIGRIGASVYRQLFDADSDCSRYASQTSPADGQ